MTTHSGRLARSFLALLALLLPVGLPGVLVWADPPRLEPPAVTMQRPVLDPLSTEWVIERVDGPRFLAAPYEHNLALDSTGNPHVAYGQGQLSYAWRDGLDWYVEMVDQGGMSVLELDAADRPHIAYATGTAVKYAWYDGAEWQIQVVGPGTNPALVLDGAGRPYLAYTAWPTPSLTYAHNDGGGWIAETIDGWGEMATMDLDASGRLHVAYYNAALDSLRYAFYDGVWMTETITGSLNGSPPSEPSLVVDVAGRPHVVYTSPPFPTNVEYAYRDQGVWYEEVLQEHLFGPWYGCSLALDAADRPHVVFSDYGYMEHGYFDGNTWIWTLIDDSGKGSSVVVGEDGFARVLYAHFLRDEKWGEIDAIRYARATAGGWQVEVVDDDPAGSSGDGVSLVLDAADRPHLSYVEDNLSGYPGDYLRYAYYDGLDWQRGQVLGDTKEGQGRTSLNLDDAGNPHIVFDAGGLYAGWVAYLHLDGSAWVSETIGEGEWPSAHLDAAGRPHVVYVEQWQAVMYAWYDGQVWQSERIANLGSRLQHASLDMDSVGTPHVSFGACVNPDEQGVYYAWKDDRGWRTELVAADAGCGHVRLVLDAAGRPHIGYEVPISYTMGLRYAFRGGAGWITSTVDVQPLYTNYRGFSLALDFYGQPHMVFSDPEGLHYVHRVSDGWSEQVVAEGSLMRDLSLALNSRGRPRIAFQNGDMLEYAYITGCLRLEDLALQGPDRLPTGQTGYFTATYAPPTATLPLVLWNDGAIALTRPLSWTVPGSQTLYLTATNDCSAANTIHTVTTFCQPLEEVAVSGPQRWPQGIPTQYTATYTPFTASLPLTLTWDNGTVGPGAIYSWTLPATYTVLVAATNCGGSVVDELTVTVFCQPVEEVVIEGSLATLVGQPTPYVAMTRPITASPPLTLTWDNGESGL